MRKVASFRLSHVADSAEGASGVFYDACKKADEWIAGKGTPDSATTPATIRFLDGRIAEYESEAIDLESQRVHAWQISEPSGEGTFRTWIELAHDEQQVELNCELFVGGSPARIAPLRYDPRCPNVLREIVGGGAVWTSGGDPASTGAVRCSDSDGGRELCERIWSQSRRLPVVVVSDHQGLILHPNLPNDLARDLCGVATVIATDSRASWEVTRTRGREWSCYNGAIRIYWPISAGQEVPQRHPLWTAERLLHGVPDTGAAADRIRNQIRRRIFGVSSFAHSGPALSEKIRVEAREQRLNELRNDARQGGDWKSLADEYAKDNDRLRREIDKVRSANADLTIQLTNLQESLQWQSAESSDVTPEEFVPPETVSEAVDQARDRHGEVLVFGTDVERGVQGLSSDAGPPDKLLKYLDGLAEMTKARVQGTLGTAPLKWLNQRGIVASGEGEVVRKSKSEMAARTWNDGVGDRQFNLHLKPVEAVSPDRCVRIYFDFDDESGRTVVGWLGRHP